LTDASVFDRAVAAHPVLERRSVQFWMLPCRSAGLGKNVVLAGVKQKFLGSARCADNLPIVGADG
jgi:hypothetical protein